MLKEYFFYREICDDERMDRYFSRTIDIVRDKYKQMLRVESIEFDPLVSKYFEAEYVTKRDSSSDLNRIYNDTLKMNLDEQNVTIDEHNQHRDVSGDTSYSDDYEGTNTENKFDDRTMSSQESGTNGSQSNTQGHSNLSSKTSDSSSSRTTGEDSYNKTTSSIAKNATKAAPMNASGVGTDKNSGMLTGLDFEYASAYSQNDNTVKESNKGNNTSGTSNNGNSETTDIGNNDSTTSVSGTNSSSSSGSDNSHRHGTLTDVNHGEGGTKYSETDHQSDNGSSTNTRTGTNTNEKAGNVNDKKLGSENEVKHDRYAGRDDVLPQDAMASATHYLMNYSTAFQWLCNKLEPCFIGVYDI